MTDPSSVLLSWNVLDSNVIGRGQGQSKRRAEQSAARQALELFGVQP